MSINNAILGILSYKSSTGYDLKKIMQESPFMHWSGNNNQIYKALIELLDEGLVTNEVQHQESSPSKKVYTITQDGLAELKNWVLSTPEAPEFKKIFLVQLAWSDQLTTEELNTLLSTYENEIRMQILLHQEKKRRQPFSPARTAREVQIWDLIYENIISSYENELDWIQKVRQTILSHAKEERKIMTYNVIEKGDKKYIECALAETPLSTERDALDLIGACGEHDTYCLMLHSAVLAEDFFKLRTGLAGQILQKFVNYNLRVAVILGSDQKITSKFKELIAESNKGNDFRVFKEIHEAENWLLNLD